MSDPFTDILTAIWQTLEDHSTGSESFTALVPDANRIKTLSTAGRVGNFHTVPRAAVDPMVTVSLDSGRSQVICSSGTELDTIWMFDVKMADQRPVNDAFPVMWACYRAMASASAVGGSIRSLTFSGLGTVTECQFVTFDSKYGLFSRDGGLEGWRTMWAYEVRVVFTTNALPP